MGKEHEFLAAVRSQNIQNVQKIVLKMGKSRGILSSGKQKKININCQDIEGMTAIHHAAYSGNIQILKYLFESSAHADLQDNKGLRPIHYASGQGRLEAVQLLLQWGSSPNAPAFDGSTPLHLACRNGHTDVVKLLTCCHGDLSARNIHGRSSLDLACEYGHLSVVELLLSSSLVQNELYARHTEPHTVEQSSCMHLAARAGQTEILRLILRQPGVDINRQIAQGTCLHIAALQGHLQMARMLLDLGIDASRINSYEQTAVACINKSAKGTKDLKQILKKACVAIPARAVKDYCDVRNPSSITFREGDAITVLDQCNDGMWKGFVTNQGTSRAGYFPASYVTLDQSRGGIPSCHVYHPCDSYRHGPMTVQMSSSGQGVPHPNMSASTGHNNYPVQDWCSPNGPGTPSPSASSTAGGVHLSYGGPGGHSNRNSAASVDSGRSSAHTAGSECGRSVIMSACQQAGVPPSNNPNCGNMGVCPGGPALMTHHRCSMQSMESGVVGCRQSCVSSSSSSSLGSSIEQLESGVSGGALGDSDHHSTGSGGAGPLISLAEFRSRGMSDSEIMKLWLSELQLSCYADRMVQAGYDLFTMSRMTPEDLNAVGVTNPKHRKRLKTEMSRLDVADGLPDHIPESVPEWLKMLNLSEYCDTLASQGYLTVEQLLEITWEDLEEIGIRKLGHQKKISLAVGRLRRIKKGSNDPSNPPLAPQSQAPTAVQATTGLAPCCVNQWPYPCQCHHPTGAPNNSSAGSVAAVPPAVASPQLTSVAPTHQVMVHSHPGHHLQQHQSSTSPGTRIDHTTPMHSSSKDKPELANMSQLRLGSNSPSSNQNTPLLSRAASCQTRPSAVVAPNNTAVTPSPVHFSRSNSLERGSCLKKTPPAPPKRGTSIRLCSVSSSTSSANSTPRKTVDKEDTTTTPAAAGCYKETPPLRKAYDLDNPGGTSVDPGMRARSASTVSMESNSIPFANENCGTIKHRQHAPQMGDGLPPALNIMAGPVDEDLMMLSLQTSGSSALPLVNMTCSAGGGGAGGSLRRGLQPPLHLPYDTSSLRRNAGPNSMNVSPATTLSSEHRSLPPDRKPPPLPVLPKPSLSNAQASAEDRVRLPNLDGDNSSTGGDFDDICDMLEDLTDLLDREIDRHEDPTSSSTSSPHQTRTSVS